MGELLVPAGLVTVTVTAPVREIEKSLGVIVNELGVAPAEGKTENHAPSVERFQFNVWLLPVFSGITTTEAGISIKSIVLYVNDNESGTLPNAGESRMIVSLVVVVVLPLDSSAVTVCGPPPPAIVQLKLD